MLALKDLLNRLGSGNLWHEGGFPDMSPDVRSTYVANTGVAGMEQADVFLLIGTNPRVESPVFNARLRKAWLEGVQVGGEGGLGESKTADIVDPGGGGCRMLGAELGVGWMQVGAGGGKPLSVSFHVFEMRGVGGGPY